MFRVWCQVTRLSPFGGMRVLFVATPLGHGDCILSSGLMPNTEHSSVLYVQKCDIVVDKPGRRRWTEVSQKKDSYSHTRVWASLHAGTTYLKQTIKRRRPLVWLTGSTRYPISVHGSACNSIGCALIVEGAWGRECCSLMGSRKQQKKGGAEPQYPLKGQPSSTFLPSTGFQHCQRLGEHSLWRTLIIISLTFCLKKLPASWLLSSGVIIKVE